MEKHEFTAHVRKAKLTAAQKSILFVVADRYNWKDGTPCFASQQTIADDAGMHRTQANQEIKELKEAGWLSLEGRSRYMTDNLVPVVPDYTPMPERRAKKVSGCSPRLQVVVATDYRGCSPQLQEVVASGYTNREDIQEDIEKKNKEVDAQAPAVASARLLDSPASPLPPLTSDSPLPEQGAVPAPNLEILGDEEWLTDREQKTLGASVPNTPSKDTKEVIEAVRINPGAFYDPSEVEAEVRLYVKNKNLGWTCLDEIVEKAQERNRAGFDGKMVELVRESFDEVMDIW